jgi:hypothetical protein
MSLGADTLERLARFGYTSEAELRHWREVAELEGRGFVEGYLDRLEEAATEYHRWFPRLQTYADECRRAVPVPAVDQFSIDEREQHRILLAKMRGFVGSEDSRCVLARRPFQAAILSTTRVGLAAAAEVFGGSGAVILEESEREHWFRGVYRPDPEAFWWYAIAWWTLREPTDLELAELQCPPLPRGSSYWEVISGVQWGSLAGGANHELWRWDGERAEPLDVYMVTTY